MRQRISVTPKRLPATAIAFTALVVVLDGTFLVVNSSYVRERPLWTAFWVLLGLGLLAALVIWRQPWAWSLCLIGPIAYLVSPAWTARFHPVYDVIELTFLALLLTPSMRRHAAVLTGRHQTQEASRGWTPSPRLVSLGVSGGLVLVVELEARHHTAHTVAGQIFGGVLTWLLLAAAIRLAILIAQQSHRLAARRDTSAAPEQ
jgi:hypothetical protein